MKDILQIQLRQGMAQQLLATVLFALFIIVSICFRLWYRRIILGKEKEQGTIYAKWTYPAIFVAYYFLIVGVIVEYFFVKQTINVFITATGITMYVCAFLIRNWTVRTLNEYWSIHIEVRKGQKLIKEGPYKYLRHPNYVSVLIEVLGFSLIPNCYYMSIYVVVTFVPILFLRTYIEEKEMIRKFGDAYINYKNEVYAFLPFKKRGKLKNE